MPTCTNCQAVNQSGNVRCERCNTKLPSNEAYNCPNCKSVIGPFAQACRKCGKSIQKTQKNVVAFPIAKQRKKRQQSKKVVPMKKSSNKFKDKKSAIILVILIILCVIGFYDLYIK